MVLELMRGCPTPPLRRRDLGVLLIHAGRYDEAESELLAYSRSSAATEDTEPEKRALQALCMALPSMRAEKQVRCNQHLSGKLDEGAKTCMPPAVSPHCSCTNRGGEATSETVPEERPN